ncbi:MAG: MFS transporter [Xanthobacteraceae bacterium]
MTVSAENAREAPQQAGDQRTAGIVACGAHALHDGYTDLIYLMLPLWQAEFGLSYAELGILRGMFSGTMAAFQIPSALVAERIGAATMLALGTALAGFGYCIAGLSGGYATLLAALFIGGLGASAQHPIASALVAHAYAGPSSFKAIGTYNFAGDLGKMIVPAVLALMLTTLAWRPSLALLGGFGVAVAAAILLITPRFAPTTVKPAAAADALGSARPKPSRALFWLLLTIAMIDSATRMGFLLFLPFLLTAKGANLPTIGLALTLVFAGGAAGKLVCAFAGAHMGPVGTIWLTEAVTAAAVLVLLPLPLIPALILLPAIGVALNGTSSVLYGSVPALVLEDKRTRAFSIFYTGTIGAGAGAPALYGLLGDMFGITAAVVLLALIVLLTLPLAVLIRPHLRMAA